MPRTAFKSHDTLLHEFAARRAAEPDTLFRMPRPSSMMDGCTPPPNGRCSARGDTVYSYRTAVAVIVRTRAGEVLCHIPTTSYGPTTRRHIDDTVSAFRRRMAILEVTAFPSGDTSPDAPQHALNLAHYAREVETAMNKARSARKWGASHLARADRYTRMALDYCGIFGLPQPALPRLTDDERIRIDARTENARAERRARYAPPPAPRHARNMGDYGGDRMHLAGDTVRTSRGAIVPAAHVRRALPLVQRAIASGRAWHASPDAPVRLGSFNVDSIGADGTVNVGCHTFAPREVAHLAAALNPLALAH